MKKQSITSAIRMATCVLSLSACHVGVAQTDVEQNEVTTSAAPPRGYMTAIALRHVKPSIMAWFIDSEHHPKPLVYQSAQERELNAKDSQAMPEKRVYPKEKASRGNKFELPEGIDRIVAIDSQNSLLIYGTEAGARELRTLIDYLDKPIRQVEATVQFIEVDRANIRELGIDYNSSPGPFTTHRNGSPAVSETFYLGFVRGNLTQTLNKMFNAGTARRLGMSQLTLLNNMPAKTSMQTTASAEAGNTFPTAVSINMEVTPTINADDTITILMQPQITAVAADGYFTNQNVNTVANMRDGDTLALKGFTKGPAATTPEGIPLLNARGKDIIMLLTAKQLALPKTTE